MAKKKRNRKRKKYFSFLSDERFKLTLGIFLVLFSLYLYLAFTSYFFTWKTDQSFEWSRVFSGPEVMVDNWAGKFGAFLANKFINHWFGIASAVLPFILLIAGLRLINIRTMPLGKTTRILLVGTILLSIILSFMFGDAGGFLGSGPGGGHGYFLSEWFSSILGKVGTIFLLSILVLAFALFSFDSTLEKILSLIKKGETSAGEDTWISDQDEITPNEGEDEGEMDDEADVSKTDESLQFKTRGTEFGDSGIGEDETGTVETGTDETGKIQDDNGIEMTVEKKQNGEMVDSNTALELEDFDPTLDLSNYRLPSIELLEEYKSGDTTVSEEELISNKNRIVETLGNYKIQIDKIKATIGPTVTLYEIVPAPGVRISKIKNLEDDIALSLSALGIRIIAPIPGRGTIGIEVPNRRPEIVSMRSIIASKKFQESKFELAIGLGKTISNETYVVELTKMPHLLIAGATGQGKSVGLNAIIASLLYKKHPAQLKFVMIDPKKVELTLYNHIEKHYLAKLPDSEEPIINDTQEVIRTLNSLTIEMDNRYNLLKSAKVRIIKEYNEKFIARKLNPREGHRYLPYIVVIVDEFADLIMTAGREIEMPLARLAQLARAVGLHLIIATQRPSTNIITGSIKANFPVRLAFKVTSMMDSRTILDSPGANQLVGRGDMLITVGSDMVRLQCAFIDTPEIERITDHISAQQSYPEAHLLPEYIDESKADLNGFNSDDKDDLFEKAARLVVEFQQGSTSLIQRKFSIGYNRAGRIIDQLESVGIVGPYEGSKARQVLIKDLISLERFLDNDPENPLSI
ncbi:MAG: DNA translocase FtsK 4TM domain-containing protein [Bacteroidales bacterium]|nr:DNA translocase FtsK 4TM domain-containing protein [Bacteroidales bacterium]